MRFDRRLIVAPARSVLRLITVMALAAGVAGLVATVPAWLGESTSRPAWLELLLSIPLKLAVSFLPAAIAWFMLMPSAAELGRAGDGAEPPALFLLFLIGLCGIAAFQLAPLGAWWSENLAQVNLLIAPGIDPFGLTLIPVTLLLAMPVLASAVMLTFVLTSIMTVVSRTDETFRVLAACVALQGGLVLGAYLLMNSLGDVGAMVSTIFASEPPSADRDRMAAEAAGWFSRQQALGDAVVHQLIWIVGGYAVALAVSEFLARRGDTATVQEEPLVSSPPTPPVSASKAAAAFDHPSYGARPVLSILSLFRTRASEYRIASIPPASNARFTFSWSAGILRRDADGVSVLSLRVHERRWLTMSTYAVNDGDAGTPLGFLRPSRHDWDVVSISGDVVARVVRQQMVLAFTRYVADVAGIEVCRFTWTLGGISPSTTELEIEFLPECDRLFDRALAIAIAPLLEEQARRSRQRR
jgi:hypothetical protein